MHINDISIWGTIVLLLLTALAASFFLLIDRRLGVRLSRAMLVATIQLAVLSGATWTIFYVDKWWADVLWLLIMMVAVCLFLLRQLRWGLERLWLPVLAAILIGTMAIGAVVLWTLTPGKPFMSHHLFIPVAGILLTHLLSSVGQGMQTYLGSLRHTTEHRHYLLASGATHLESIMPSARRAIRAALMPSLRSMTSPVMLTLPPLFCGMLMFGASPLTAVTIVWLLLAACFTATVLTLILAFRLSDKRLFDKQDNLLATSK